MKCIQILLVLLLSIVLVLSEDTPTPKNSGLDKPTTIKPSTRIVGGLTAVPGQLPHQVALYVNTIFNCSGSIITPNFVLTAAQCVHIEGKPNKPFPASALMIRAGSVSINCDGQLMGVSAVRSHPFYGNNINDIAVLKLAKPLEMNNYVSPIPLAAQPPPPHAAVFISGWGSVYEDGPLSPVLQLTTTSALCYEECRQRLGPIPPTILCLDHFPGIGMCYGDAGGPGVYEDSLVGIASSMVGTCGSNNPDAYTNVAAHVNWILRQLF